MDENSIQEHAVLVALGLVYYLRLNEKYREKYKKDLKKTQIRAKTVDEALKEEVGFDGQNRVIIIHGIVIVQSIIVIEYIISFISSCHHLSDGLLQLSSLHSERNSKDSSSHGEPVLYHSVLLY